MAENTLMPTVFTGKSSEDCEDWLGQITKFAAFRGLSEEQTIALFSLSLKDTASLWS